MRDGVPDLTRIYQIDFPASFNVNEVAVAFSHDPHVEYAEPIPVVYKSEIPNDPNYGSMYHLPLIMAPEAWNIHHGEDGAEVLIGIPDDAVAWRHNDLVENVWQNLGEDADGDGHVIEFDGSTWIFDPDDENEIDDDGNGMVDDFVGWDFINENGEQDNDPQPELSDIDHGTHCIGIADGRTNNGLQIASVPWNVKFVAAKHSNSVGNTYDSDVYEGLIYVAELGADIITNSWTSGGFSMAHMELIEYARSLGCIIVAAAGNDNSQVPNYPASYPGVVSVAATTVLDLKADFSNYGLAIDVSAPGANILSLAPYQAMQYLSGTSMATPLAAGLLAYVKSYNPGWSNEMIINQVLGTCDDIDTLQPYLANKLGYGRINALRALSDTGVTTQQELRLMMQEHAFADEDGDGFFAPGEFIDMSFSMMNFAVGMDTTVVSFNLLADSPHIVFVDDECSVDVPADDFFGVDSAFRFRINPELDSTLMVTFTLVADSNLNIPLGNEWNFELVINQSGILVYNGTGTGNAYSGEYIRDFLQANSPLNVFYTQQFPPSFSGFDAVFLSFGNYGQTLSDGTYISQEMTGIIADYLYNGGYLYEDCGSFYGLMDYFDYPNQEEMEDLFCVDTVITPLVSNGISHLSGLEGSVAEGLEYNGSTQLPNYYIDIMAADSGGTAMFEEEGYGIVAVQGEGEYGQRTVCFSYAISKLTDNPLGTRDELMTNIALFFELISVGENETAPITGEAGFLIYPNPAKDIACLSFKTEEATQVLVQIHDLKGELVKEVLNRDMPAGNQSLLIQTEELPAGVYLVVLKTGRSTMARKLMVLD
jgi:hypothetical protein